jgi:hypothetical protein
LDGAVSKLNLYRCAVRWTQFPRADVVVMKRRANMSIQKFFTEAT